MLPSIAAGDEPIRRYRHWLESPIVSGSIGGPCLRRVHADIFHVVDHSYGHLAWSLRRGRPLSPAMTSTRSISTRRPTATRQACPTFWFAGCRRAWREPPKSSARARRRPPRWWTASWSTADRVAVVYNGVDLPETPAVGRGTDYLRCLGRSASFTDLLHVGSTAPRKRLDLLLHVFAEVLAAWPSCRLVRVGGPLTPAQRALSERLGILGRIVELPSIDREVLAAVYRRATLLLSTSEREGFGLPVAEALAAGTPVVATDCRSSVRSAGRRRPTRAWTTLAPGCTR